VDSSDETAHALSERLPEREIALGLLGLERRCDRMTAAPTTNILYHIEVNAVQFLHRKSQHRLFVEAGVHAAPRASEKHL
jgi:hypothetical protein